MSTKTMTPRVNLAQTDLFEDLDTPAYRQFLQYHEVNPQIWLFFRRYALKAIGKGHKHLSAEWVFNIIRWETAVGAGDDEWKINNNYKPFYSRLFMREFPQYEGFFRKRASKADKVLPGKVIISQ